jgi:alkylation response protein AidB-like acyl-CoA dehydrogenase
MTTTTAVVRGGSWLIEDTPFEAVFTPEALTDEHRLIAKTARDFADHEVLPRLDELEAKDWDLARQLVAKCGALGLLGTDAPEAYGGLELDKVTSLLVAEGVARSASFCTTFGSQTGLAILPLVLFGTDAQKARYLPGLVSGERVGAYALSESGSGSDALGARTRATRLADGGFALTGEKMWITNCSFADVYIVFAKVDGEAFTAFIVERGFPGVSVGREEHKMGLHGSSTAPLILQDARVPAENVLGEIGKGHKVAFNVLNYGRFKLGAMASGGARAALTEAARYAATRRQFGKPIAEFGAIRYKLSEMAIRLYAVESLLYRTAGLIDQALSGDDRQPLLAALEEYAIESSIAKVAGSEMLDYVLDENVQIHGGNGYVRDYPAERHYRDARVNRIFEGTNEINRLLIAGMLMRRAVKGDIALIPAAKQLQEEIVSPSLASPGDGLLEAETFALTGFRKTTIMLLGMAMQRYGDKASEEQEVLSWAADVAIETYAAESAVRRAQAAAARGVPGAPLHVAAAQVLVCDAASRVEAAARQALPAMAEGDMLRIGLAALRRLVKITPINTVIPRRAIAARTVEVGGYPFA